MSTRPIHDTLCDLLPEMALEMLHGPALRQVLDHAAECEACARALREYREVVAGLALLTPERTMDAVRSRRLRDRLLARARADSAARGADPGGAAQGPAAPRGDRAADRWMGWTGWVVAAGLSGVLLVHHSVHRPVDYGWLVAGAITVVPVVVGMYALALRAKASALRDRLDVHEAEPPTRDPRHDR